MHYMKSDEIRDIWLQFFKDHGHHIEESASLIPNNDPSLLWINAGVTPLKKYFDGTLQPKYRRITNAQKCIRTNDIDNVGHTSRHHTFFEMLGNFSIGDYFRNEVIPWAYELLTSKKYYDLDPHKLFITYYPDDLDTYNLWIKCGIPQENMVPSESNFWEIGEGPCGPDTEINYDRGESFDKENKGISLLKNDEDNERYIELWNIVFSQYDSKLNLKRSEYKQLPQKNIDTGAGLERLACIMQGTETNFETDLFMPYIKKIESNTNLKYNPENATAYRVIVDHVRTLTFALADGAIFSNDGRGYVLRRLLRRASRYANLLKLPIGFISSLVDDVTDNMAHYYPYLKSHSENSKKMILSEEVRFSDTLKSGEKILASFLNKSTDTLSAQDAFKLSDTYGFPFELTKEITLSKGKKIDEDGYKELLKKSKELARNSRDNKQSFNSQSKDLIDFTTTSKFSYDEKDIQGKVIGLFIDGNKVDEINEEGDVAFDNTNFYATSGGQLHDVGFIVNDNCKAQVVDVNKANHQQNLIHVKVLYGSIKVGEYFMEQLDKKRRESTTRNHSATHLLQKALQENISKDIHQEGAYYDDLCLHFDFNFERKLSQEEIYSIEDSVNKEIQLSLPVSIKLESKDKALKENAMHLFNEKYGDTVRVVSMGKYSKEFCGGCHVKNTKDIGIFTIVSEESVAAGIRRITAYTGEKAYEYLKEKERELYNASQLLKLNSDKEVLSKIKSLNSQLESFEVENRNLKEDITNYICKEIEKNIEDINNNKFVYYQTEDLSHEQLVSILHKLINKYNNLLVCIFNHRSSNYDIAISKGNSLSHIKCGQILKEFSSIVGGKGGGKDDIAFGSTNSANKKSEGIKYLKDKLND